ncbi:hypothetical protein FQN60_004102, partial [Etheostoma spectabile]
MPYSWLMRSWMSARVLRYVGTQCKGLSSNGPMPNLRLTSYQVCSQHTSSEFEYFLWEQKPNAALESLTRRLAANQTKLPNDAD